MNLRKNRPSLRYFTGGGGGPANGGYTRLEFASLTPVIDPHGFIVSVASAGNGWYDIEYDDTVADLTTTPGEAAVFDLGAIVSPSRLCFTELVLELSTFIQDGFWGAIGVGDTTDNFATGTFRGGVIFDGGSTGLVVTLTQDGVQGGGQGGSKGNRRILRWQPLAAISASPIVIRSHTASFHDVPADSIIAWNSFEQVAFASLGRAYFCLGHNAVGAGTKTVRVRAHVRSQIEAIADLAAS